MEILRRVSLALVIFPSFSTAADSWKMESQTQVEEITSSPGSAYAGRTWRSTVVHIKNISGQSLFVFGNGKKNVFVQVYRYYPLDDAWIPLGLGYCGTGARYFEIKPDEAIDVEVNIPTMYQSSIAKVVFDEYSGNDHKTSNEIAITGINVK
jgi:hypothetical protein